MMTNRIAWICLAVLASLAFLPASNWVIKNDLDYIAGKYRNGRGEDFAVRGPWIPSLLKISPQESDDKIALAMLSDDPERALAPLVVGNSGATAPELAHYLRYAFDKYQRLTQTSHYVVSTEASQLKAVMIRVAGDGMVKDRNNAFFALISWHLEPHVIPPLDFRETEYHLDDYSKEAAERKSKALVAHYGYRGAYHLSHLSEPMAHITDLDKMSEKGSVTLFYADVLANRSTHPAAKWAARRMAARFFEYWPLTKPGQRESYLEKTINLKGRPPGWIQTLRALSKTPEVRITTPRLPRTRPYLGLGVCAMVSLICILLATVVRSTKTVGEKLCAGPTLAHYAGALGWLIAQQVGRESLNGTIAQIALGHAALALIYGEARWIRVLHGAVVAFICTLAFSNTGQVDQAGFAAAAFVSLVSIYLRTLNPVRRIQVGVVAGWGICLAAAVATAFSPLSCVPLLFYFIASVLTQERWISVDNMVIWPTFGVIAAALTGYCGWLWINEGLGMGHAIAALAAATFALFLARLGSRTYTWTVASSLTVFTVALVLSVAGELKQDRSDQETLKISQIHAANLPA
jgi:hypothetical protein